MLRNRTALTAVAAFFGLFVGLSDTHAQTFSNTAAINVPTSGNDGRGSLYPSPITVTGAPASIGYISVTLNGFSHTFVNDVNVLLVSPTGQQIMLMASTNGSRDAVNNTLTFIPDGTATLPFNAEDVVSGVYACSVYFPTNLPAPAPVGPYATSLAPLIGTNPNGTWNLYAWDRVASFDDGTFAGGWSITFNDTLPLPITNAFTYQGVLSANGTPITGNANVRFTLCESGIAPASISSIAPTITRSFTGIADGRITTTLDFGTAIESNQALWLSIEVESPPGSGFVTLNPSQPITPTPQARLAQRAIRADTATSATSATTATTAAQLAPGRVRIRGDAGPASASPGIWFASPINAPIDRAFIGQRDDANVGIFNNNWVFLVNANGNTVLGDFSGNAPPERLTVNGSIQINTGFSGSPTRLAFGPVGNLAGNAESSDAVYLQRVNPTTNNTDLRLYIGDDAALPPGSGGDAFSVWTNTNSPTSGTERFRFQSDGIALKPGGGAWGVLSDPRAKHDIAPLAGTLDKLMSLRGYSFLYNDDRIASGLAHPGTQIGLMADEVARVFPDWVSTDATGTRYVTERATTALMVEALRDLRAEKDKELEDLRQQNLDLQRRLEALEKAIVNNQPKGN